MKLVFQAQLWTLRLASQTESKTKKLFLVFCVLQEERCLCRSATCGSLQGHPGRFHTTSHRGCSRVTSDAVGGGGWGGGGVGLETPASHTAAVVVEMQCLLSRSRCALTEIHS